MFRALRELLLSGNIKGLLDGSRKQARLLAQFSPEFGSGRGRSAEEFLRSRGVDVEAMLAPGTGNPYMGWTRDSSQVFMPGGGWNAESPFGGVVFDAGGGRRLRFGGDAIDWNFPAGVYESNHSRGPGRDWPIMAPYEGFRALPGLIDDSGMTALPPAPWQGRGQGPMWGTGQWSNFGGSPRNGLVSGYDELGEVLYPSPVPMEQIYRDDRWWYPQFRNPDRSVPRAFRGS